MTLYNDYYATFVYVILSFKIMYYGLYIFRLVNNGQIPCAIVTVAIVLST